MNAVPELAPLPALSALLSPIIILLVQTG
jgi:hypothetical protein